MENIPWRGDAIQPDARNVDCSANTAGVLFPLSHNNLSMITMFILLKNNTLYFFNYL